MRDHRACLATLMLLSSTATFAMTPDATTARQEADKLAQLPPVTPPGHIDYSGRKQQGQASYYAPKFANRKMADGNRFNPNSNAAACRSLPLGTTATVTNLRNGRTATIKIEDRSAPMGRVVDVTPKVAHQLDMTKVGIAPVVVAPIAVVQPDGRVKPGAGAADPGRQQSSRATAPRRNQATR